MSKPNKLKIFNDPIYGFIGTPSDFIYNVIGHPYFQRLRRISQMGMSYLVYPGAHHTRFHHALGSMHLMRQAVAVLRYKNIEVTEEEENALLSAILLHDIGHGPFSHALEARIYQGQDHEKISLGFMRMLNDDFKGKLDLAISIFEGKYHKPFMNELISSQLDMDRLDYLKRDSFYTGVTEGNINSERLITMLNVVDGHLVVEEKGIYAVEKFLMARRFMYWQAYLHKTSLVAELLLIKIMERAKYVLHQNMQLSRSKNLLFFLDQDDSLAITDDLLYRFSLLDDIDVLGAIKDWQFHQDKVLSRLCKMLLDRKLLKIKIRNKPVKQYKLKEKQQWAIDNFNLEENECNYFVFSGKIDNKAYDLEHQNINILKKSGEIIDVAKASDHLALTAFSKTTTKYYFCYPEIGVS